MYYRSVFAAVKCSWKPEGKRPLGRPKRRREDNTWSDNLVRELATVCLPWQHWTKALVWFDDVDISAFHSCVVVDLWQSLSEWHILLTACVLVCRRENVGA